MVGLADYVPSGFRKPEKWADIVEKITFRQFALFGQLPLGERISPNPPKG